MKDWGIILLTVSVIAVFVVAAIRSSYQTDSTEENRTDDIIIHPSAREEFAGLFAAAIMSEDGRKVLVPLMAASGKNFTAREALMLKYTLGKKQGEQNS